MAEQHHQNHNNSLASDGAPGGTLCLSTIGEVSLLPFVGRESELKHLSAFIRNATTINRLSLLWIQGEAGIGKSRLLAEAEKRADGKIAVVNIRFVPDATFSLAQAFVIPLQATQAERHGRLSVAAADSLSAVLALLRDVVRLQPTLLVLEDLHLLDAAGVADLVTILHGMEEERLGVICIARPGSETAFGATLPFLIGTLELRPLRLQELREMGEAWGYDLHRLPRLTQFLYERTGGVPLIIRSALNDLLTHRAELTRNPLAVVRSIAHDIGQSHTHGLTGGLSQDDIDAARRLATLGETFSVEGAEILLENAEKYIDRLCRADVLTQSFREVTPLFGFPSERPRYSFTHSLLHERLLSEAPPPNARVFGLLESNAPIYATTFFVYIARHPVADLEPPAIIKGLECLIAAVDQGIDSPHWKGASIIRETAQTIFSNYRSHLSESQIRTIRFELLRLQLRILNAFPSHPDFIAAADELLEITDNPCNETAALQRLKALEYGIFRADKGWIFRAEAVFEETEQIIERFPGILLHSRYIDLMGHIAGALRSATAYETLERVRKRFDAIIAAATSIGDRQARREALLEIAPSFLSVFRTQKELEDRKALADIIAAECGEEIPEGRFVISWPRFLESICEMRQAKKVLAKWTAHPLSGYDLSREFALRLLELVVNAALDTDLETIEREAGDLLTEFHRIQELEKEEGGALAQTAIATHLFIISLMRGEVEWGNDMVRSLCDNYKEIGHYMEFERAALTHDVATLQRLLERGEIRPAFLPLLRYCVGGDESAREEACKTACALLDEPIIQRSNILSIRLVLALIRLSLRNPDQSLPEELKEALERGINQAAQWLADRKLPAFLRPLLREAQPLLEESVEAGDLYCTPGAKPVVRTKSAPAPLKEMPGSQAERVPGQRVRISMIGEISFTLPGKKSTRVRGPRPQQLLAMLTANTLLTLPLSLADFRVHVTGSTSPEESANYLRVLVSRVRKQLGADAILSDGESAPKLNPDVVEVDLIEGTHLLQQALSLARNRRADQAWEALTKGLELLTPGEPYPELSGEIFAAAREELKGLMRQAILETATLLKEGNDLARAEEIRRRGDLLMPEDGEMMR